MKETTFECTPARAKENVMNNIILHIVSSVRALSLIHIQMCIRDRSLHYIQYTIVNELVAYECLHYYCFTINTYGSCCSRTGTDSHHSGTVRDTVLSLLKSHAPLRSISCFSFHKMTNIRQVSEEFLTEFIQLVGK